MNLGNLSIDIQQESWYNSILVKWVSFTARGQGSVEASMRKGVVSRGAKTFQAVACGLCFGCSLAGAVVSQADIPLSVWACTDDPSG